MRSIFRLSAVACIVALAVNAAPAFAQYANEFAVAKVIKQGHTSQTIAGKGRVEVKVQVNADGTHKVIGILKSTNAGDNDAALEIAETSTYKPATRGKTPVPSFYTYVLNFNGSSVSNSTAPGTSGSTGSSAPSQFGKIDALVRSGKYDDAISQANAALLSNPGNPQLLQLLGAAQFFKNNLEESAQAFARVDAPSKAFQQVAANALAGGAVKVADSNPTQALTYAQKAVAILNNNNTQFALGVAQIANKQYPDGIATLKAVLAKTPATEKSARMGINYRLLTAYLATNDSTAAQATAAEMKATDPSSNGAAIAIGSHYIQAGMAAVTAKNFDEALKDFDQAAASGVPKVAVTAYTQAAFTIVKMEKPDWAKAKDYATKAVAIDANDIGANYALGVAWQGTYAGSRSAQDKAQALNFLKKADDLAKAAGQDGLSLQIENQIKSVQ